MFRITKDFHFEASHTIEGLPEGHKCSRVHGHSYTVRLFLEAEELSPEGFVVDFGELKQFGGWLDERFDHRHLNDLMGTTTAEYLAQTFFTRCHAMFPQTVGVGVSETRKTWAFYFPESPSPQGFFWDKESESVPGESFPLDESGKLIPRDELSAVVFLGETISAEELKKRERAIPDFLGPPDRPISGMETFINAFSDSLIKGAEQRLKETDPELFQEGEGEE